VVSAVGAAQAAAGGQARLRLAVWTAFAPATCSIKRRSPKRFGDIPMKYLVALPKHESMRLIRQSSDLPRLNGCNIANYIDPAH
jgi:hypothetical protein